MASVGPQDLSCRPCNELTQEPFSLSSALKVCADPFTFQEPSTINNSSNGPSDNVTNTNPPPKVITSSNLSSTIGIAVGISVVVVLIIGGGIYAWFIWRRKNSEKAGSDSSQLDATKKDISSSRSTLANIKAGVTERNKTNTEFSSRIDQRSID